MITGLLKRSTNPKGENIKTHDGKEHKDQRWDSTPGTSKDDLFGLDKINRVIKKKKMKKRKRSLIL